MGLFKSKEVCSICNVEEGDKSLADGCICKSCAYKGLPFLSPLGLKSKTVQEVKTLLMIAEENQKLIDQFQPTKTIKGYVSFDHTHGLWRKDGKTNDVAQNLRPVILRYEDIISYELIEDGDSVTKGGVGTALVGGALSGGVGAITGGIVGKRTTKRILNEYIVKVVTRCPYAPSVYINLLKAGPVKAGSIQYRNAQSAAQEILTTFAVIMDALNQEKEAQSAAQQPGNAAAPSTADEILKFKALLDQGIITEEEFEAKKQQLLGL